jgi:hypothetical protein
MLREHSNHRMRTQHVSFHAVEQRTEEVQCDHHEHDLKCCKECNMNIPDQIDKLDYAIMGLCV